MELLRIGGIDYTNKITVPSYKVNEQPVYTDWVDGNFATHRHVNRMKISGSFTMLFTDIDEYNGFFSLIREHSLADGSVPVLVYVNNRNEVRSTNVFIKCEPTNTLPFFGTKEYDGFDVTIEEM